MDINFFYLNTKPPKPQYMKIKLDILPQEIVDKYNLLTIARNGYVYIKLKAGCTDFLKQASWQTS